MLIIGIRIILLAAPRKKQILNAIVSENEIQTRNTKNILENPEIADTDKSGDIGYGETIVLGIALSANALAMD